MGDLQFAKQFLTTIDAKPTKYQADHVFDPKVLGTRVPYTLPKLPHPPHPLPPKSSSIPPPAPGSEPIPSTLTLNLTLKSTRNPSMSLLLPSTPANTTLSSLKSQIQSHLGGPSVVAADKIKILLNKKPVPASKGTVAEALDGMVDKGGSVEFGVLVMGGAPDPKPQERKRSIVGLGDGEKKDDAAAKASAPGSEKAAAEVEAGAGPMEGVEKSTSGAAAAEVVASKEFWDDLQGFLEQRVRDSEEAVKLRGMFERAWRSGEAKP